MMVITVMTVMKKTMKRFLFSIIILNFCIFSLIAADSDELNTLSPNACLRRAIEQYNVQDYKGAEEFLNHSDPKNLVVVFYKAKLQLDLYNAPAEAEKLLLPVEGEIKKSTIPNIHDAYYSVLLQCKFQQEKWNEMPSVYGKIKAPDSTADYAISAYYYNRGDYAKVKNNTGILYASALSRLEQYEAACNEYEKLNVINADYVRSLFALGRYEKAYEAGRQTEDEQKDYICGLCQVNLEKWSLAKNHFTQYIKDHKSNFNTLCFFYKGYCEYNLEEFKDAYASFVRFALEADESQRAKVRLSYEYAAKAALQCSDYDNAAIQAENIVKNALTAEEKQKSVLFAAGIYSDAQKYERALNLLKPYTTQKNDFAAEALFFCARIYESMGDTAQADTTYQKIIKDFSRSGFAEEAVYKSGELYYSQLNYALALNRFNSYIYKYAHGKYVLNALYYAGECALKIGENERAVLFCNTLLSKYENSSFAYGARKNLLEAYIKLEDYAQAYATAKELLKLFPEQAAADSIGKKTLQLEQLLNGTDKRIVEKLAEYEANNKAETLKGRLCGTELVQLYAQSQTTQKEAFALAQEIFAKQEVSINRGTAVDERAAAAQNAEFIADYRRKNDENTTAAALYLKAAEYYRSAENGERSAICLYGAAEAFVAAGMTADARETARLLKKLYPESRQAQRIDRITGADGD